MRIIKTIGKGISHNLPGCVAGFGSVLAASWLADLLQHSIFPADTRLLYMPAIVPITIFFGFEPTVLACVLSVSAYAYFFTPLPVMFEYHDTQDILVFAVFLYLALISRYLVSNLRKKNRITLQEIDERKQYQREKHI